METKRYICFAYHRRRLSKHHIQAPNTKHDHEKSRDQKCKRAQRRKLQSNVLYGA